MQRNIEYFGTICSVEDRDSQKRFGELSAKSCFIKFKKMFQNKKILLTLLFILYNFVAASYGVKYKCEIFNYGERCDIEGLNLTRDSYEIEVDWNYLDHITTIVLHGTVPILSATKICEALPNLERFFAEKVSLEEIEENSFQRCSNLKYLSLDDNKFIKLERNAFQGLSKLETLFIKNGNIIVIDLDLTHLEQLSVLGLRQLNITILPAEVLREQNHLKELYLYSNNLFDLDIERVLTYLPNLQIIHLADNNFKCNRLMEILDLLNNKNIRAWTTVDQLRKRNYTPNKIGEIHCLTDQQWELEYAQLSLEQQSLVKNATKHEI